MDRTVALARLHALSSEIAEQERVMDDILRADPQGRSVMYARANDGYDERCAEYDRLCGLIGLDPAQDLPPQDAPAAERDGEGGNG